MNEKNRLIDTENGLTAVRGEGVGGWKKIKELRSADWQLQKVRGV